jgi:hypothetical protein
MALALQIADKAFFLSTKLVHPNQTSTINSTCTRQRWTSLDVGGEAGFPGDLQEVYQKTKCGRRWTTANMFDKQTDALS